MNNILKNKKGFTLMEMIVAVAIFSTVTLAATSIFQYIVEGQRSAIASQNIQEATRYSFEAIGKEVRMAILDEVGTCHVDSSPHIYSVKNITNDELYFMNQYEECVAYYLEDGRLKIERGDALADAFITPDDIAVSDLKFAIEDDFTATQPRVTIKMKIKSLGKDMHEQDMYMQTTISSRYYGYAVSSSTPPVVCTDECLSGQVGCLGNFRWECEMQSDSCYDQIAKEDCSSSGLTCILGICQSSGGLCGNSLPDSGEECDDGNIKNSDGCDAGCQWETNEFFCAAKPEPGTNWNTVSQYTQTCDASNGTICTNWLPANSITTYDNIGSGTSCRFKCAPYAVWNSGVCEVKWDDAFITVWQTDKSVVEPQIIRLPLTTNGNYDFVVDWGDGNFSTVTDYADTDKNHIYSSAGTYTVRIAGLIDGWSFGNPENKVVDPIDVVSTSWLRPEKLTDIMQWGNLKLGNNGYNFYGAENLTHISATDQPVFTLNSSGRRVVYLDYMFGECRNLETVSNMNSWDLGGFWGVSSLKGMFHEASKFNQDISGWETGNIIYMNNMFLRASDFNQPLSGWDTHAVKNMGVMFYSASSFNQDLSAWDVDQVTECLSFSNTTPAWSLSKPIFTQCTP